MQAKESRVKPERIIDIEGVINFRDLGGYHTGDGREVKWGQLYRSAQLDRMTERGMTDMAALDIKVVVDLRFSGETQRYPTLRAAVPNAEMLSWHDEAQPDSTQSDAMKRNWRVSLDSNDPVKVRAAMRENYPKKLYSHSTIYRKMLLRLSAGQTPLLFHCAAGKDRTGVAAALILSLLGVSDEQIVADYLLTQQATRNLMDTWLAGGATDSKHYEDFQQKLARHSRTTIQPVFDADETYISTLLDYVGEHYGGFANYASHKLELSGADIESLKENLLS